MKNTPNTLLEILAKETEELYSLGYEWLQGVFLPLVHKIEQDILLTDVAELYQILGEIYQENNAYSIAQTYYEKVLQKDVTADQSHYALVYLYEIQGQYYEALAHLDTLLDLYLDNSTLQEDKARMQENIIYDTPPFVKLEDTLWQFYAQLATGNTTAILEKLGQTKEVEYYKILLMAYGVEQMTKAYLGAWEFYCTNTASIELEKVDWFYMPKEIYRQEAVWKQLLLNKHKISSIVFIEEEDNEILEESKNLSEGIIHVCHRHISEDEQQNILS